MDKPDGGRSLRTTVIGGLFAAVIAPTMTGLAVWFITKKLDDPKSDVPASPPQQAVVPTSLASPVSDQGNREIRMSEV